MTTAPEKGIWGGPITGNLGELDRAFRAIPHFIQELLPGPREEAIQAVRWQRWRRYALDAADGLRRHDPGPVCHLVNLLPWQMRGTVAATLREALLSESVHHQLLARLVAIGEGQLGGLETVPGFEAFTLEALGLVVGRSDPERMFQLPRRGSIGGPFDPTFLLHWVAVLWNAARVKPGNPDYLDAQATFREALANIIRLYDCYEP